MAWGSVTIRVRPLLEADLTCLYKSSTWRETRTHVVHAECKSFNYFEYRDVNRVKDLAQAFPDSVLVFATLNDGVTATESRMIGSFAIAERKKRLRGKPHSPVIVLTGIELFSSRGVRDCWEGRDGLYAQFNERHFDYSELSALADATQQLYLGLSPWHEQFDAELEKRRQKRVHMQTKGK